VRNKTWKVWWETLCWWEALGLGPSDPLKSFLWVIRYVCWWNCVFVREPDFFVSDHLAKEDSGWRSWLLNTRILFALLILQFVLICLKILVALRLTLCVVLHRPPTVALCCPGECTTFTLNLALQARSRTLGPLSPSFQLVKNLREAIDKFLPDDAHEIASGRLHISLTRVSDRRNILVSQFSNKNDLIDVSCFQLSFSFNLNSNTNTTRLWNSLPSGLRKADLSYFRFRWSLKTFLFGQPDTRALWTPLTAPFRNILRTYTATRYNAHSWGQAKWAL